MKRDNNQHIHWYPGHIAKAERKLKEQLGLCDVVVEVRDARIPLSSAYDNIEKLLGNKPRLILLNKSDLTDNDELVKWINIISKTTNCYVMKSVAKGTKDLNSVVKKLLELSEPRIEALIQKGLLRRPARVMVVGMPNVGKSSIINKFTKSSKTKIGAKAGVTRQQQWVRINKDIDLLDTPGIIPTTQDDQVKALKLAFVNSVSENAYSNENVAKQLLEILKTKYFEETNEFYKLDGFEFSLEGISQKRNWVISGNKPDIQRTSAIVLRDFRDGKIGKFILDDIEE